jgi:hypothetical protein
VEWAGVVVEGFVGRVENPATFEEIAVRWGLGSVVREVGGVEAEEEEGEEDEACEEGRQELRRHCRALSKAPPHTQIDAVASCLHSTFRPEGLCSIYIFNFHVQFGVLLLLLLF